MATMIDTARIKALVPMGEVAAMYGFAPSRAGFICCPFHGEKSASLKIYPGERGWHCFGCHDGGDVIDFVARLFGLGFSEAARRLDADFALGLGSAPADDAKVRAWKRERAERERRRREKEYHDACHREERRAIRALSAPKDHRQAAIYGAEQGRLAYLEYRLEENMYPKG